MDLLQTPQYAFYPNRHTYKWNTVANGVINVTISTIFTAKQLIYPNFFIFLLPAEYNPLLGLLITRIEKLTLIAIFSSMSWRYIISLNVIFNYNKFLNAFPPFWRNRLRNQSIFFTFLLYLYPLVPQFLPLQLQD